MQIKFAKPDITDSERRMMNNLLLSIQNGTECSLTHGKQSELFGEEFKKYIDPINKFPNYVCVPVSSCMAALHLSYLCLGIGKGDEVIVPAMSHVATAHAVEHVGATPVFVDCDYDGNIDYSLIEKEITRKTKAISIVHFLGTPCNMYKIMQLCEAYGLYLVEDCALSIGTTYDPFLNRKIHVGLFGDFGCFSFYPCKTITTGEGGMVVCKDIYLDKIKQFMQFGKRELLLWYDIYELGLNYRMDELSAVLGREQLRRLQEEDWVGQRKKNVADLANKIMYINDGCCIQQEFSKLGIYCLNVKFKTNFERDQNYYKLTENGVQCSVYYPSTIPAFEYYKKKYGYQKVRYPRAEDIAHCTLALPIGQHIGEKEIDYMVDTLFNKENK